MVGPTGGTQLTTPVDLACLSIGTGSNKVDTPDTTDMLTAGVTRTFQAALENSGDVTIKWNYKPLDPGQAAFILTKGQAYNFKITAPLPSTWTRTFSGINQGIDYEYPDDKPITGSAKIQISGAIVDATE